MGAVLVFQPGSCAPNTRVEGFTEQLKRICQDTCADEYGEPPCWDLPNRSSMNDGETIGPCRECLREAERETARTD